MNTIGNILWLLLGGLITTIEYLVCSFLLMLTIVGIPFGLQTLKFASLTLWPFGRTVVNTSKPTGCLYTFMNILWIFLGGIWISITHLIFGIFLYITIIGIPFGRQHFKLASIALVPFGKNIVSSH